jgi:hypothetical protein
VALQQQKYEENMRRVINGNVELKLDTQRLDMSRVRQEDMKNMLPTTDAIKKDAIEAVKRDNRKQNK